MNRYKNSELIVKANSTPTSISVPVIINANAGFIKNVQCARVNSIFFHYNLLKSFTPNVHLLMPFVKISLVG